MSTMTMDRIDAVIQNANMRFMCAAVGTMAFVAADHSNVETPTLVLVDPTNEDEEIARISAHALETMMTSGVFMDYVQSLGTAVRRSYETGKVVGRTGAQLEMRRAMGLLS